MDDFRTVQRAEIPVRFVITTREHDESCEIGVTYMRTGEREIGVVLTHDRINVSERDRHKPTPPPKPAALVAGQYVYRDMALTPEMYNQLRGLQKKAKDLRQEVRNLRRMSQAQAHTIRETILDTFITIRYICIYICMYVSGSGEIRSEYF